MRTTAKSAKIDAVNRFQFIPPPEHFAKNRMSSEILVHTWKSNPVGYIARLCPPSFRNTVLIFSSLRDSMHRELQLFEFPYTRNTGCVRQRFEFPETMKFDIQKFIEPQTGRRGTKQFSVVLVRFLVIWSGGISAGKELRERGPRSIAVRSGSGYSVSPSRFLRVFPLLPFLSESPPKDFLARHL